MLKNPPDGYTRINPYLIYEDAEEAIEFLTNAFGFIERMRMPGPDGTIMHCEMCYDDGLIMLASEFPEMGHKEPNQLDGVCHNVHMYVDDVDAHHDQAVAAGAEITRPLEDQFYGDRTYGAKDCGGHHWYFAQHIKDVAPEDMVLPEGME